MICALEVCRSCPNLIPNYLSRVACILYGISRVVIGENNTYLGVRIPYSLVWVNADGSQGEAYLKQRGIEVVNLKNAEMQELMEKFIKEKPEVWYVVS